MAGKEKIVEGMLYEAGKDVLKTGAEVTKNLLKIAGKKAEGYFAEKPRALFDELIDNLYPCELLPLISKRAAKIAADRIKSRQKSARQNKQKFTEDETVAALLKVLSLDPVDDKGRYTKGHERAKKRYFEFGMMSDEDFWQSIETMIDRPLGQKISHLLSSNPKTVKFVKDEFNDTKKSLDETADDVKSVVDGLESVLNKIKDRRQKNE